MFFFADGSDVKKRPTTKMYVFSKAGCGTQRAASCGDHVNFYPKPYYIYLGIEKDGKKFTFEPVEGTDDQWYITFEYKNEKLYWNICAEKKWMILSTERRAWRINHDFGSNMGYYMGSGSWVLMENGMTNTVFSIQDVVTGKYVISHGGWMKLRGTYQFPWKFWPDYKW